MTDEKQYIPGCRCGGWIPPRLMADLETTKAGQEAAVQLLRRCRTRLYSGGLARDIDTFLDKQ